MTFLSPLFLIGAAAAAIPIVLHFLHREPEARVKFATVHLLRHAPVEDTRRRKLREWLLLALRVSALALLAVAFARPFFVSGSAKGTGGVTIVALDTSLSMSPHWPRARQLAKDAIARAPAANLVGVVTFADRARNAVAPSTDRALAAAAIDRADAGFGSTRYSTAIAAAEQMVGGVHGEKATIVLVTDLQASGWDTSDHAGVADSTRVELADVGSMPANLAVTSVRAELDRVVATIRNTGPSLRDAHARLVVDGHQVSDAAATIAAGASADVVLAGARGLAAAVSVDDPSGIEGDNTRYLALDNAGRPAILIVTTNGDLGRDAFYAQQAALASDTGAGFDVVGLSGADVSTWVASRLGAVASVVLASTQGVDARGRALLSDYLRGGGGMLVAAGPDVAGDVAGEILGGVASIDSSGAKAAGVSDARRFAPADSRHPVFLPFEGLAATLGLIAFRQIAPLEGKSCDVLARFTTGESALLDCAVGKGRALIFASDIDNRWNDFPLRASFVPFLQESLRYLAGAHGNGADMLVSDVAPDIQPVPGVVTLPSSNGNSTGARRVAVNVDPRESDPERLSPDEFQAAITRLEMTGREEVRLQASQQENRQHLWEYALLAAMALLIGESFVAMRAA